MVRLVAAINTPAQEETAWLDDEGRRDSVRGRGDKEWEGFLGAKKDRDIRMEILLVDTSGCRC